MRDEMRTLMLNNHNLKDLTITTDGITVFENAFQFKFKLQRMRVEGNFFENPQHFCCFIETQAHSLETLEIMMVINKKSLELILGNMPRLNMYI